jgi:hypothetical protein
MSYDPCGTQHLDGAEIIRRLASYLSVDPATLELLLLELLAKRELGKK